MNLDIEDFITNPRIENVIYKTKFNILYFEADPFLIQIQNSIILFFEKYSYIKKYGWIKAININTKQEFDVLNDGKHKSFPFVYKIQQNIIMIPESTTSYDVKSYTINEDMSSTFNSFMMKNIKLVDVVIFKHQNIWFMFASECDNYKNVRLRLFYNKNESFENENWQEHNIGVVKSGHYGSRMAGAICENNGKIYRFGQISKNTYGSGVVIYEIIKITEDEYQEEFVKEINGKDLGFDGMHHISFLDQYTVIDYKIHKYSIFKIILKPLKIFYRIKSLVFN